MLAPGRDALRTDSTATHYTLARRNTTQKKKTNGGKRVPMQASRAVRKKWLFFVGPRNLLNCPRTVPYANSQAASSWMHCPQTRHKWYMTVLVAGIGLVSAALASVTCATQPPSQLPLRACGAIRNLRCGMHAMMLMVPPPPPWKESSATRGGGGGGGGTTTMGFFLPPVRGVGAR